MNERLAINGGTPVRTQPFGPSHDFGDEDIAALAEVIRSGNPGKGPRLPSLSVSLLPDMASNTPSQSPPGRRRCTSVLGQSIPTPATRLSFRPGPLGAAS